jgi:hypothetical protein
VGNERATSQVWIRRGVSRTFTLAAAVLCSACGEGPTENDGRRLCEVPLRLLSPVADSPGTPILNTSISPVVGANCSADLPIVRIPASDSTSIDVPVPRPIPLPNPGG